MRWFRQFFCTVDFGRAFSNWSDCVPCVLRDTVVLKCMTFILCVEADLTISTCVACFLPFATVDGPMQMSATKTVPTVLSSPPTFWALMHAEGIYLWPLSYHQRNTCASSAVSLW